MKAFRLLAILMGIGCASPAWSLVIGGTEVGGVDLIEGVTGDLSILGDCGPGSDPATEACWAENVLGGGDLTFAGSPQTVDVLYSDDFSLAAFMLQSSPGYYIVKNAQTWVLLQNLIDIDWGVLDLTSAELDGFALNLGKANQLTISHVTEFDGTTTVPEPASLALLGAGLLALGFVSRRKSK